MTTIVLFAFILSIIFYVVLGFFYKREVNNLADIIPILKGKNAKVKGEGEFSASTVATSISLATVILAFFQLIPSVGTLLFWAVITTALGFGLFAFFSKKIWQKLTAYQNTPPSIHAYIASEYSSKKVGVIASLFTAIGYLCMFATELTVSSSFISGIVPAIPIWVILLILSVVSFTYTSMGGFRVVVVSDRIQMWTIWLFIFSMLTFFGFYIFQNGGISFAESKIPENVRSFNWSGANPSFILGLLIMNLFTYLTNMALWQRVAGTEKPETFINGMKKSIFQSALSWGLIVVIAILSFVVADPPQGGETGNFLINTMKAISNHSGGGLVLFFVSIGIIGAMLSTASTQLIAVSHTIYEDIISQYRNKNISERVESHKELNLSRIVLIVCAIVAIGVVKILSFIGFNVADLAFSIYGAALSLAPSIILSLYLKKEVLAKLKIWATLSIVFGFFSGWGSAFYGVYILKEPFSNYVFLAPVFGLVTSTLLMLIGYVYEKIKFNS